MNLIHLIEQDQLKQDVAHFRVGDTVKVYFKIIEGEKERVQIFEGLVISRKNGSVRETFTVRKISFGVGVERTFPVHSPRIDKIEVVRQGDVKRAKLYYVRDLTGKAATKVKEKRVLTDAQQEKINSRVLSEKKAVEQIASNKAKPTTKKVAEKPAVKKDTTTKKPAVKKAETADKK